MTNQTTYKNLIAFHPGSYIEDVIDDLNITQEEFANRLGVLPKTISKLINAEIRLSAEVALKLEKLTGVDYQTWINLQSAYDKKVIEIEEEQMNDENTIVDLIDISFFKKCGLLDNRVYRKAEKIACLRNIFSVSSLSYFNVFNPAVSYRNIKEFDTKSIVNSNIMLEIASKYARNKTENKLDKSKLKNYLPTIRQMALKNIEEFYTDLQKILLECGIVLVALPHLKNSNLHGATKKFKNGSVMLLVTDRSKFADIFWFSLMHEIGHILNGDFYTDIEDYEEKEKQADKFSSDFFIEEKRYNKFVIEGDMSRKSIISFSEKEEIPPWILIGRLKKDSHLDYSEFTDLMTQYRINLTITN